MWGALALCTDSELGTWTRSLLPTAYSHNHSHQFYTNSLFAKNRLFSGNKERFLKRNIFSALKDERKKEKHDFHVKLRIRPLQFSAFTTLVKFFKSKFYYAVTMKMNCC